MPTTIEALTDPIKRELIHSCSANSKPLTEQGLARRFGISRAIIREVLAKLEGQGLIDRRRRLETTVRQLSMKQLADLWDLRICIESIAARLTCAYIDAADIRCLQAFVRKRDAAARRSDRAATVDADIRFHLYIVDLSNNLYVRNVIDSLHIYDRLIRIVSGATPCVTEDEQHPKGHHRCARPPRRRPVRKTHETAHSARQEAPDRSRDRTDQPVRRRGRRAR